jgi:hypothetical protein
VRDVVRAVLISVGLLLLASTTAYGRTGFAFLTTTMQIAAVAIVLTATWQRFDSRTEGTVGARGILSLATAAVAGLLIFVACREWIGAIVTHPFPERASSPGRTLHIDTRLIWVTGQAFFPAVCAVIATAAAREGRIVSALGWLTLVAAIALAPDLRVVAPLASTPLSWPLLAAIAWSIARLRNHKTGLVVGVAALAIAFSSSHAFTFHHADPIDAIGTAGLLVRAGYPSLATPVHVSVVAVVLVFGWRAIAAGGRALPWIALALFAVEMTAREPFESVPLDALAFFGFAAAAESSWLQQRRASVFWLASVAIAMFVVAGVCSSTLSGDLAIDAGTSDARPLLYTGFSGDEGTDRTFTWIEGRQAEILLPRKSTRPAVVEIVCEPNLPTPSSTQQISVSLNGVVLGTAALREGWQTIALDAPSRAWQIGANELTLSLSNAVSPLEAGASDDARKLSAAIDLVTVRTR